MNTPTGWSLVRLALWLVILAVLGSLLAELRAPEQSAVNTTMAP